MDFTAGQLGDFPRFSFIQGKIGRNDLIYSFILDNSEKTP
jgi:hypothetical protein